MPRGGTAPHPESSFVVPRRLAAPDGFAPIGLRPLTESDEEEWSSVRLRNRDWLSPWDSNDPFDGPGIGYREWIRAQRDSERDGSGIIFAVEYAGHIVGQISLGAITYGSVRSGIIGYWIDQDYAGRGFTPLAVAILVDWAFHCGNGPRLHRVEVDILPENERSLRVVEKLGFADEGVRRGYMFVRHAWRDHRSFALLSSDVRGALADRLPKD